MTLSDPYIVNGCQTTKCIWEVAQRKLDAGGTGEDPELQRWRSKANDGVVVVKVARVGTGGETLSQTITRFTNSQNAVREKDFLALTGDFKNWQATLAERYNLYLEIQRGGWDSYKALQKQNPSVKRYDAVANAADLLKVYGAGWLSEAGMAFGKNPPFLPGGAVFRRIVEGSGLEDGIPFGPSDLYAAHLLQSAAEKFDFGRGSKKIARRQTKFLFYMVAIELIKEVLIRSSRPITLTGISQALIKIFQAADLGPRDELLESAAEAIDTYLTRDSDHSMFSEPAFINVYNNDLNGFLKWEQFGKTEQATPMLRQLLSMQKMVMGKRMSGQESLRERAVAILNS